MRHYDAAQRELERSISERDQNLSLFQEKQASGIKATEYHLFQDYFVTLEQQLLLQRTELEVLSRDVQQAKDELVQRERELKMLEITDTKDRSEFRRAQAKKEQLRLDERAIIGNFRKAIER
jgi:flagellar export protein FliJ